MAGNHERAGGQLIKGALFELAAFATLFPHQTRARLAPQAWRQPRPATWKRAQVCFYFAQFALRMRPANSALILGPKRRQLTARAPGANEAASGPAANLLPAAPLACWPAKQPPPAKRQAGELPRLPLGAECVARAPSSACATIASGRVHLKVSSALRNGRFAQAGGHERARPPAAPGSLASVRRAECFRAQQRLALVIGPAGKRLLAAGLRARARASTSLRSARVAASRAH